MFRAIHRVGCAASGVISPRWSRSYRREARGCVVWDGAGDLISRRREDNPNELPGAPRTLSNRRDYCIDRVSKKKKTLRSSPRLGREGPRG
ncbi:hypothetical protein Trydic_g16481 [Trypoxylus dichotomus]